jgi:hypothetical protein
MQPPFDKKNDGDGESEDNKVKGVEDVAVNEGDSASWRYR